VPLPQPDAAVSDFPKTVLITRVVKDLRDGIVDGRAPSPKELLDLIGSHEQLRALALSRGYRLRATEEERDRLQRRYEDLAMGRKR